jgi:hypothetical protein
MYLTIKPFLVLVAIAGAVIYFVLKSRVLVELLKSVSKPGPNRLNNIPARIFYVFRDVLAQRSVQRKLGPGIAHSLIFWGFIVITVGTLEMMVEGIFHGVNLSLLGMNVWAGYQYLADIMTLGVVLGVCLGFFRRLVLRPHYLKTGPDALFILAITGGLMLSLLLMNGFRVAGAPEHFESVFPISSHIGQLLGYGMNSSAAFAGQEVF